MRKITTAITAAALAFSMMAAAVPAAAITGYDSAYAGESAFVNITGGQTQNFQVFFANVGTTSWQKGGATEVDLAACLEDKVTCNAQDASEATWNPSTGGWLSATRYSSTTQSVTPPGSLGTFSYNITAPTGVAAGIYHFNGDLVLASTGEKIHPEGYFQDANTGVSTGAATITTITNAATGASSGSSNGGDTANIAGSGIVCNPTFPTVSFGGTNAVVTSCGATALTLTTPAHAPGSVTVTVTNPGAGPSNGLTWVFSDTTTPKFNSFTISAKIVTVTWSEPVCQPAAPVGTLAARWTIHNVSDTSVFTVNGDSTPLCNTAKDNGVTSSTLSIDNSMPNGAFVELTLNTQVTTPGTSCGGSSSRNENYQDAAGNCASAPQSRQATATAPETTAPTLVSISGAVGSSSMTLNFSEPVQCAGTWLPQNHISMTDFNAATDPDPTVTGYVIATPSVACQSGATLAKQSFKVTLSQTLPADRTYTVTVTCGANEVEDTVGNDLVCPATAIFTTGAGDFTPPTMVDARMVNNLATTDFTEAGDSFSLTFSEAMNGTTTGRIDVQDQDGTIINGGLVCGGNVSCTWNTAVTTITVTVNVGGLPATTTGTTPGMQIPFNITALTGFTDLQGNVPNVLGSSDRLVDYE